MRAIILAAGVGKRLAAHLEHQGMPKCLLRFGGRTLLNRHLEALRQVGVTDVAIAVGYGAEHIERELDALKPEPRPQTLLNPRYELGSVLSLWTMREPMCRGGDVLVMDADVLYDARMLTRLVHSQHPNCYLLDRAFKPGDEPVKICVRAGVMVEFSKRVAPGLVYDTVGESVGFFRFSHDMGQQVSTRCGQYVESGKADRPHEEVLRDLLLEQPARFDFEDVTGIPWTEIDFPEDVIRARDEILPRLVPPNPPGASR